MTMQMMCKLVSANKNTGMNAEQQNEAKQNTLNNRISWTKMVQLLR